VEVIKGLFNIFFGSIFMHEWALAEAVIAAVTEIAEREKFVKVLEVELRVGELQQIDEEIIKFALAQLKTGKLKKTRFVIIIIKAQLKCKVCGNQWVFNKKEVNQEIAEAIHFIPEIAHSYIKCPNCASPDFEIVEGRGMYIGNVRGVR
jgi:hydrogenase nickel incorporation protein HypA/HybF